MDRRKFIGGALLTGGALTSAFVVPEAAAELPLDQEIAQSASSAGTSSPAIAPGNAAIDFRYAPAFRQTAFCFPDDPHKSLVDEKGALLYGYDSAANVSYFPLVIEFSLGGMKAPNTVTQRLESPSVPVLRTTLEYADATLVLTTFATNSADEGRVDNVLLEITPRGAQPVNVSPLLTVRSATEWDRKVDARKIAVKNRKTGQLLLTARTLDYPNGTGLEDMGFAFRTDASKELLFHPRTASVEKPYRVFVRFPLSGQTAEQLQQGLENPDEQLAGTRRFWSNWQAFEKPVAWQVPGRQGEFVSACARNILQAREYKDGKLTFQVGPTCYRGLWVVDGNFILEAARYLGYDKEATEGLRTTWSKQQKTGQVIAGGGLEHYKDTAIAMFTTVRQCELSQDWSLLREYEPNIVAALDYIESLRARSRKEGGVLGKYSLLPKGFSDGGLGDGIEFTNTLWTMAGLKAIGAAGEQQNLPSIARATAMYRELYAGFNQAAAQEMRSWNGQFQYLPMLLKEDALWQAPDPWERPRPQSAQWALSHTIFPGSVFQPEHPVLQGHVQLMQAVRQEDIPAETGWNHHEAVWTYNAAFVAEVYLWLGMKQQAHDTFVGFLNHASPQYCWREEQPLQNALIGSYVGDMPHNWASAECIRYMRHILALEDGENLRLLAGVTDGELASAALYKLTGTPTRFGRLDLALEPLDRKRGWRLSFRRGHGSAPKSIELPARLGGHQIKTAEGVHPRQQKEFVSIDPAATEWSVTWSA